MVIRKVWPGLTVVAFRESLSCRLSFASIENVAFGARLNVLAVDVLLEEDVLVDCVAESDCEPGVPTTITVPAARSATVAAKARTVMVSFMSVRWFKGLQGT